MVINIGWLRDGKYDLVENEIRTLKAACGDKVLKVIIETCLLTDEEKVKMCELVTNAGAEELHHHLPAHAAGGGVLGEHALLAAHDADGVKAPLSLADGLEKRGALGAVGRAVGGVLDVAAAVELSILGQQTRKRSRCASW